MSKNSELPGTQDEVKRGHTILLSNADVNEIHILVAGHFQRVKNLDIPTV